MISNKEFGAKNGDCSSLICKPRASELVVMEQVKLTTSIEKCHSDKLGRLVQNMLLGESKNKAKKKSKFRHFNPLSF
jgi:hypothetical protein